MSKARNVNHLSLNTLHAENSEREITIWLTFRVRHAGNRLTFEPTEVTLVGDPDSPEGRELSRLIERNGRRLAWLFG